MPSRFGLLTCVSVILIDIFNSLFNCVLDILIHRLISIMNYRNGSCVFCEEKFDEAKDYHPLHEELRPYYMGLEGVSTHCTCLCLAHYKCAYEVLQKEDSKCTKCDIYFNHIYELDFGLKHIFKDIDDDEEDDEKEERQCKPGVLNEDGVLEYECGGCSIKFLCRKKRFRCEEAHRNGKKPLKCPMCTVTFTRKDNLNRHIKNTHEG